MRVGWLLCLALGVPVVMDAQAREIAIAADLGNQIDPIARFDGKVWTPISSAAARRLASLEWTRWALVDPASRVRLQLAEPRGRCASPRALPVNSPASSSAKERGYLGLAATGAIRIDAPRRITESAAEWKAISSQIATLFERRAQVHGLSPALLGRVPMSVDWVFATAPADAQGSYYFEASKRIPDAGGTPAEDPKGEVRVLVSGWLRAVKDQFVQVGSKSDLFWGPEEASSRPVSRPLGVVHNVDERIWVMNGRVGVRDSFTLYALRSGAVRTLLTTEAASC